MKRVFAWGTGIVALLALLTVAVTYPRISAMSRLGTGYVALNMCACTLISGREFDACLPDMLPDMDAVRSEPTRHGELRGVRAWVPLYAESVAFHHPPDGCTLEMPD